MDYTQSSSKATRLGSVITSALIATSPIVVRSGLALSGGVGAKANLPRVVFSSFTGVRGSSSRVIRVSPIAQWNGKTNARFNELARKEALGGISIGELAELESLAALRRSEKSPRTADQILWDRRQEKITHDLIQALQAYVEFHETSHST